MSLCVWATHAAMTAMMTYASVISPLSVGFMLGVCSSMAVPAMEGSYACNVCGFGRFAAMMGGR